MGHRIDGIPVMPSTSSTASRPLPIFFDDIAAYGSLPGSIGFACEPAGPFAEHILQRIWEAQNFRRDRLMTTDGRTIEVLSAGTIQCHSGPDLEGARLRIDGQEWMGNVEIHLKSSEWDRHGHQRDPAYDNVILHVVHEHDREVRTRSGFRIPTLELKGRIPIDPGMTVDGSRQQALTIPCAASLRDGLAKDIGPWITRLATKRLERRSRMVRHLHRRLGNDAGATIQIMLFRAYGMSVNAIPFEMLARSIPQHVLWKLGTDTVRMEALLLGQAGLLPASPSDGHFGRLRMEYAHLMHINDLRAISAQAWRFGRMRPANFPTIRIAQLCAALLHCGGSYSALLEASGPARLRSILCSVPGTSLPFDVGSGSVVSEHTPRMGRAAADSIILNAIVPLLHGLGTAIGRKDMVVKASELLEHLPPESNRIVKDWSVLGIHADSAAMTQGLVELRNEYCVQHRCLYCHIGMRSLGGSW